MQRVVAQANPPQVSLHGLNAEQQRRLAKFGTAAMSFDWFWKMLAVQGSTTGCNEVYAGKAHDTSGSFNNARSTVVVPASYPCLDGVSSNPTSSLNPRSKQEVLQSIQSLLRGTDFRPTSKTSSDCYAHDIAYAGQRPKTAENPDTLASKVQTREKRAIPGSEMAPSTVGPSALASKVQTKEEHTAAGPETAVATVHPSDSSSPTSAVHRPLVYNTHGGKDVRAPVGKFNLDMDENFPKHVSNFVHNHPDWAKEMAEGRLCRSLDSEATTKLRHKFLASLRASALHSAIRSLMPHWKALFREDFPLAEGEGIEPGVLLDKLRRIKLLQAKPGCAQFVAKERVLAWWSKAVYLTCRHWFFSHFERVGKAVWEMGLRNEGRGVQAYCGIIQDIVSLRMGDLPSERLSTAMDQFIQMVLEEPESGFRPQEQETPDSVLRQCWLRHMQEVETIAFATAVKTPIMANVSWDDLTRREVAFDSRLKEEKGGLDLEVSSLEHAFELRLHLYEALRTEAGTEKLPELHGILTKSKAKKAIDMFGGSSEMCARAVNKVFLTEPAVVSRALHEFVLRAPVKLLDSYKAILKGEGGYVEFVTEVLKVEFDQVQKRSQADHSLRNHWRGLDIPNHQALYWSHLFDVYFTAAVRMAPSEIAAVKKDGSCSPEEARLFALTDPKCLQLARGTHLLTEVTLWDAWKELGRAKNGICRRELSRRELKRQELWHLFRAAAKFFKKRMKGSFTNVPEDSAAFQKHRSLMKVAFEVHHLLRWSTPESEWETTTTALIGD